MKKFIFCLYHEAEAIRIEIYARTYPEAKINVSSITGCHENKMLFIKETKSLMPQQWIF